MAYPDSISKSKSFLCYADDAREDSMILGRALQSQQVNVDADFMHEYDPPNNWAVWKSERIADENSKTLLVMSHEMKTVLSLESSPDPAIRNSLMAKLKEGGKIFCLFLSGYSDQSLIPPFLQGGNQYQIDCSQEVANSDGYAALVGLLKADTTETDSAPARLSKKVIKDATPPTSCHFQQNGRFADDIDPCPSSTSSLAVKAIGRDADRKTIMDKLDPNPENEEAVDVLLLWGPPGIGKSFVAEDVKQLWKCHPRHQVKEMDMNETNCEQWANYFLSKWTGDIQKTKEAAKNQLMAEMARCSSPSLVIVENAEAVNEENWIPFTDLLEEVIQQSKGKVRFLVMSKKRFQFDFEASFSSLNHELLPLNQGDSVKLFNGIAIGKRKEICTQDEVSNLCSHCEGIPLIITTLARHIQRNLSVAKSVVKRLIAAGPGALLKELKHGSKRQKNNPLFTALEVPFSKLTDEERETVISVSAFPGHFEPDVVAKVLDIEETEAEERVCSLTFWQEVPGELPTYRMHGIFREFARTQAETCDKYRTIYSRAAANVITIITEKLVDLSETFSKDALAAKEIYLQEQTNLQHLLDADIPSDEESVRNFCKVALNCPFVFDTFLQAGLSIKFFEKCIKAAQQFGLVQECCQLQCWVSQDHIGEGSVRKARDFIQAAGESFHDLPEEEQGPLQCLLNYSRGLFIVRSNEAERSDIKQKEAMKSLRRAEGQLVPNSRLGILKPNQIIPEHVTISLAVRLYMELAHIFLLQVRPKDMIQCAHQAKKVRSNANNADSGKHPDAFMWLNTEAVGHMVGEDYECALSKFEMALAVHKELMKVHRDIAISMSNMGQCYQYMSQYGQACEYFKESHEMLCKIFGPTHKETLRSLYEYAICLEHLNRLKDAAKLFIEILQATKKLSKEDVAALDFKPKEVERELEKISDSHNGQ